jgi:hypothetical protein
MGYRWVEEVDYIGRVHEKSRQALVAVVVERLKVTGWDHLEEVVQSSVVFGSTSIFEHMRRPQSYHQGYLRHVESLEKEAQ